MLVSSESILQNFELPYRVVVLSTGDMGFSNVSKYMILKYGFQTDKYREIASLGNAEEYNKTYNIRFKRSKDAKLNMFTRLMVQVLLLVER